MLCSAAALCLLLSLHVAAVELPADLAEQFRIGALEEAVPEEGQEWSLTIEKALALTPEELFDFVRSALRQGMDSCRGAVLSLLGISLLAGTARQLGGQGLFAETAETLSALFVVLTAREPLFSTFSRAGATIRHVAQFLMVFVPVYAGVSAAGGAAASATLYQTSLLAAAELIAGGVSSVLLPLCFVLFELCIAEAVAADALPRWSLGVKKAICFSLGLVATVLCAALSLQSVLTNAAGHTAARTGRFLAEAFVPVIGKAIADGIAAVQGGLRILRAAVGTFGIAAAAATFLPAVLETGLLRLGFAAAQWIAELFDARSAARVLCAFGQLQELLLALLLTLAVLLIASTAILLSAGGIPA